MEDKIPNVGKRRSSLDNVIKQMQKNNSYGEEFDMEAEKVMGGFEGEKIGKITAILTGIFDEMKDLKNETKI